MRKLSLITVAGWAALATTATLAQSTVTVYGLLDGGYNRVSGLKNGTASTLASGIMEGSRFGMRGSEDIGGGYQAIFTLENRLELDTGGVSNVPNSGTQLPARIASTILANLSPAVIGALGGAARAAATVDALNTGLATNSFGVNVGPTGNRLFDRQAFAGVITPVGAFTLGRQYTPGYLVTAAFDASHTQSSLSAGQVAALPAAFDIRMSNTLQYGIALNGVTATLMYGAGEVAGSARANRFLGAMAMYQGAGFGVGYGHNEKRNELGDKSLTNDIFGASVDVGPGTLYGQYVTIKDNNPSGLSPLFASLPAALTPSIQGAYNTAFRQDARLYHIGYKFTFGPSTIVTAYNRLNDRRTVNADTDSYGVTYTYALSKRTNLNAVLTRFNNKGQGQAAPGGNGFLGGVTAAPGVDATNVAFGIRHYF